MYARMRELGVNAPIALRAVEPERVARAVLDAIAHDRPDLLVSAWPMRPLLAVQELAPRLAERIVAATGAGKFFALLAEQSHRSAPSQPPPWPRADQEPPRVTM
jgi:hypothetical protein